MARICKGQVNPLIHTHPVSTVRAAIEFLQDLESNYSASSD